MAWDRAAAAAVRSLVRGFALAREDDGVVTLHAPIVGEIENVVWGTHDQSIEIVLHHQLLHALKLRFVDRPWH